MTRLTLVFATALLVVSAVEATAEPTSAAVEQAARHYQRGKEHMDANRPALAVKEFLRAQELSPSPALLFNIAQAYFDAGERRSAQEYYDKYLAVDSVGPGVEIARERLDELTRELGPLPEPEPPVVVRTRPGGGRGLRMSGIIAAGIGLVAVGTGVYFGTRASSLSDEVTQALELDPTWNDDLEKKESDGESAETTMYVMYGVGGAALIAGGVLWYLGIRAGRPVTEVVKPGGMALTPMLGSNSAGFALRFLL